MSARSSSESDREEAAQLLQELDIQDSEHLIKSAPRRRACSCCTKVIWYYVALFFVIVIALISVNSHPLLTASSPTGQSPPWYPTPFGGTSEEWAESYEKARLLVNQMTFAEKVNITTGIGWMMGLCVGNTGSIPRLKFPSLCLQDGPLGIRFTENITAFPAGVTVAATWDRDLFYRRGRALGAEAAAKGVNVLLGPAMGPIGRSPLGGRNWEGFGADPFLQGIAAAKTIAGIQGQGVIATAKHWLANEQEHFRIGSEWLAPESISVAIDDRTLHEFYAWPFQDSVKAGVGSVMCSYQQVNNSYACQNSKLLNGILKEEFGFQGFVVSDWLAQKSGVASALSGLDMTMPGDGYWFQDGNSLWGEQLTKSVLNGSVPIDRLNDMAMRIVATWYQLGQDDAQKWGEGPNFSSWTNDEMGKEHFASDEIQFTKVNKFIDAKSKGVESHADLARKIAAESIVLLKNDDHFLPLDKNGKSNSAQENTADKITVGIIGSAAFDHPEGPNACQDRACVGWALGSGWGSGAVEFPYLVSPHAALDEAFDKDSVDLLNFPSNSPTANTPEELNSLDLCIVFLSSISGEGYLSAADIDGKISADRNHLFAQNGGEGLVGYVTDHCGGDVVVVIHSVGPVIVESFIEKSNVKAVLSANLPGQESGHALADVVFGAVNPSGKLPYTMGKLLEDYGPAAEILRNLPPDNPLPQQTYDEGTLVDYRHFDYYNITPRFEFGYGLSYSEFELLEIQRDIVRRKTSIPDLRPPPVNVTLPTSSMEESGKSIFPSGFHRLKNYIYSYIQDTKGTKYVEPAPVTPSVPSPAGGVEGGHPSLWDVHVTINATVMNTSKRAGACVVQVYVKGPELYLDPVQREIIRFPERVLRGFSKIWVEGESVAVASFELTRRDLSYWSSLRQQWVMPMKHFDIEVGFSSRDLPKFTTY